MRGLPLSLALLLLIAAAPAGYAQDASPPTLYAGAVEVGGSMTLSSVEGVTSSSVGLYVGTFFDLWTGLLGAELGTTFHHVSSRNILDLELQSTWQRRLRDTPNYPFAAVAVGMRREDIGSFGATRFPVGFGVGLRTLFGQRAALRTEYRFRRVLDDPVADYNEHHLVVGFSVFFNNKDG